MALIVEVYDYFGFFSKILRAIDIDPMNIKISSIRRLGRRDDENREKRRPIKITLEKKGMRTDILRNAKKLGDINEDKNPLKKIYLKPDVHPEIRKEEKRLYEVFKSEKAKPSNAGYEVKYDRKNRVVSVNGEEVDSFRLFSSSFH